MSETPKLDYVVPRLVCLACWFDQESGKRRHRPFSSAYQAIAYCNALWRKFPDQKALTFADAHTERISPRRRKYPPHSRPYLIRWRENGRNREQCFYLLQEAEQKHWALHLQNRKEKNIQLVPSIYILFS